MKNKYYSLKSHIKRFGLVWTILLVTYKLFNKVVFFEILYIILNDRNNLKKPKLKVEEKLSFKNANKEDLINLQKEKYDISNGTIELLNDGVICLLNYSNNELAGYTFADISGRSTLKPYLKLEIPDTMVYNFAGFTLPKFRGRRHQGIRHYEVMQLPQCLNKKYLLGYVDFGNFTALRGNKKSGYFKIGYIMILGKGAKRFIKLSKNVKRYNIRLNKQCENNLKNKGLYEGRYK